MGVQRTMSSANAVKQIFVACLGAPKLIIFSVSDFNKVQRLTQLFEKQPEERNCQSKDMIVATSHRASIDDDNMRIFSSAGWIQGPCIQ